MRYTEEEGRAIINNFYGMLERNSNAAQSMQAKDGEIKGVKYSGVAVDLYYMTVDLIDNYGYGIAAECVERCAMYQPEMEDPRYFYDVSLNRDLADMQEAFAREMELAMEQMAKELEKEKARQEQEERERKEEEQRQRERAREQAERAREIEEKYKQLESVGKAETGGIIGKAVGAIGSFFGRLFGRR